MFSFCLKLCVDFVYYIICMKKNKNKIKINNK